MIASIANRLPDYQITQLPDADSGSALRRPRQRGARRRRSRRRRGAADLRQRRAGVGARRAGDRVAVSRERAARGARRARAAARLALASTCATSTPRRTGRWRGARRRITRRTRTCICPAATSILLGKAAVFCAAAHIDRLVLGTLGHNPFPDATPEFRAAMARALSLGLAHDLRIDAPYAEREQGRRHPARRRARRAVRADACPA